MQTTRWNKKRLAVTAIGLFMIYVIFSGGYNKFEIDTRIKNTKAEKVWEFISDFSKMKLLNPTILDFKITSDAGNHEHWRYSVMYKERLSHWPYAINIANADYSVRKLSATGEGDFAVASKHRTCFLAGFYCLKSEGEFIISQMDKDTYVVETVLYQCPMLLGAFCRREVAFQRTAIIDNLALQFNKNN